MFCPNCGKDNSPDIKYCAACGTNLEAVTQALIGREGDFFTRIDSGMDQFISRYNEHIFSQSRLNQKESGVVRSWKILGQGLLTSFIDLFMFILMWNFLPLRAMILLITTPFRLLAERGREKKIEELQLDGYNAPELNEPAAGRFLADAAPSVTEHTTTSLGARQKARKAPITDKLE
jgi:hypothetical protein